MSLQPDGRRRHPGKTKEMGDLMKQHHLLAIGITAFILLALAAIGGFAFWGWGVFADQAKEALNNNPVIQQHIGEVDEIELDFAATGEVEDEDVFVFRIEGSKGSGVVTAEFVSVDADTEEIRSGTLQLSSGETYDLTTPNLPFPDDE